MADTEPCRPVRRATFAPFVKSNISSPDDAMNSINFKKLRKKLFVNQAVQGRLLVRGAVYWFVYHGVLWMSLFLFRYAEHRGAMMAGAAPRSFSDLFHEFAHLYIGIWVCAVAIVPLVLWDFLSFSHRVVGPLVRFQKTLERLIAGQPVDEIRLRDTDLLNDLNETFNRYLATLPSRQLASEAAKSDGVEDTIADEVRQLQAEVAAMTVPQTCPELSRQPA